MNDFKEVLKKSDVLVYFVFPSTTDFIPAIVNPPGYKELTWITGGDMFNASV